MAIYRITEQKLWYVDAASRDEAKLIGEFYAVGKVTQVTETKLTELPELDAFTAPFVPMQPVNLING